MKKLLVTRLFLLGIIISIVSGCAPQVQNPKPTDTTAQVNGYTLDNAGHYSIVVTFSKDINPATVVAKKTLKLHFTKDSNADAILSWSGGKVLKITTVSTRDQLNQFSPDDHFSLTLIGTDEGNGVVKSADGNALDGDYNNSGGGNYVMPFTVLG